MVSQGSQCDSDGVPAYMQDVSDSISEEGVEGFVAPSKGFGGGLQNEGFESFKAGRGFDNIKLREGVLGSIPIVASDDSSDEGFLEDELKETESHTVNPIVKAAFAINRNEREELVALRKKMMDMSSFLEKNGLSMAKFEKDTITEESIFNQGVRDYSRFISGRDEFGLPIFVNGVTGTSGLKDSLGCEKSPSKDSRKGGSSKEDMISGGKDGAVFSSPLLKLWMGKLNLGNKW